MNTNPAYSCTHFLYGNGMTRKDLIFVYIRCCGFLLSSNVLMFEPIKFKIHKILDNVNAKLKFWEISFYQGKSSSNAWVDVELKFVYDND